jgi:hypothetical protein
METVDVSVVKSGAMGWDGRLLQDSRFQVVALGHDALSQLPIPTETRASHHEQDSFAPPRIQPRIHLAQPDNAPTNIIDIQHAPRYSFKHGARLQTSSCEPRTGGGRGRVGCARAAATRRRHGDGRGDGPTARIRRASHMARRTSNRCQRSSAPPEEATRRAVGNGTVRGRR